MYIKKTETHFLASRLFLILLIILWHCCAVEWFSWKPNWYGGISLLIDIASSILLRSSLSNTLTIMGRRLMGPYDFISVGSFPGLDVMTN
jgi:hypothetical protein